MRGGKNYKKHKKGNDDKNYVDFDDESGNFYYGTVEKKLGDDRMQVKLHDGNVKQCTISGKHWKKIWYNIGDLVRINQNHEILGKVKNTDKDVNNARAKINKTNESYVFDLPTNSDDEDDVDDKLQNITILHKKQKLQQFKENDKTRTLERNRDKELREYTDPTELAGVDTKKKDCSDSDNDFNMETDFDNI